MYRWEDSQQQPKSVRVRPYVGGGVNVFFSSLNARAAGFGEEISESTSSTDFGVQAFGGLEFFFSKIPRLSMSADIGYYSTAVPFSGFRVGGFALGTSVHWYIR